MTETIQDTAAGPPTVERLAGRLLGLFPKLDGEAQRLAVQLYRLVEKGQPVALAALGEAAGLSEERVKEHLSGWPSVFYENGRIIGFWGLTARPFSAHRIRTGEHTNYGWCAWDTLFLPELLGKPARVESKDPETGETIRLSVSPQGVEAVDPPGAVLSFLDPPEDVTEDVVNRFCHFIHFFVSSESAQRWGAKNPGVMVLSIAEGFRLGKLRNHGQFKEALEVPAT